MFIETPPEIPTHLLENSELWITPVGRILRKASLDELPQILSVFTEKCPLSVLVLLYGIRMT